VELEPASQPESFSADGIASPSTFIYPQHLRELAEALPPAPGVYTFHGEANHHLPLYIGKSIHVRQRVLSHLRTAQEARMLRQTRRFSVIRTAGEVGALLLEAQLIKTQQPLYNQRLRRSRQLCAWLWHETSSEKPQLVDARTVPFASTPGLHGLFASRRAAEAALMTLADAHQLCHVVLGLEKAPAGKACFRHQIRRCAGACCGAEPTTAHQQRLASALQTMAVTCWPRPGAVALTETCPLDPQFVQHHVVRNWYYLGTASTLEQARLLDRTDASFDADSYHILCKPLLLGSLPQTWLN